MTSTGVLVAGVIAALFAPAARLYVILAAFGVVIVCVALATTIEVRMTTTAAKSMTNGREDFWIRILTVFIMCGSIVAVCVKTLQKGKLNQGRVKYWEIIADNLSKAGWSWGCVSALDARRRTIFVADAHRDDGKRFVVHADERLTMGRTGGA